MYRGFYTLALLYMLFFAMPCYSYQETITHPNMSELATKNSQLGATLTSQLSLTSGLDTIIPTVVGEVTSGSSKTIREWLLLGSEEEDDPMCRASNHFHNPLNSKPWENSYLMDWPQTFGSYCSGGWGNRYSNIVWATGFSSPAPYGDKMAAPNPWAWDSARTYYELAFKAGTVAEREQYLADTFLSLGHILHLLQDMAVPAHVRSDFMSHLSRIGIRGFNPLKWPYEPYENYVRDNNYVLLPESLVPIRPIFLDKKTLTNYWDTDVYEATCTHVAPRLAGPNLGLAEYTNANPASRM